MDELVQDGEKSGWAGSVRDTRVILEVFVVLFVAEVLLAFSR